MSHAFKPERTNAGHYFSDCSCGLALGVYQSRADAKEAHRAHVEGRPAVGAVKPVVQLGTIGCWPPFEGSAE